MPFWPLLAIALLATICEKCFVPVTGLEFSHGNIFSQVAKISVGKTEVSAIKPTHPLT